MVSPDAPNVTLNTATAQLVGWPTCSSRDWKDTPGMAETGTNPDGSTRTRLDMLPRVAALVGWSTPNVPNQGPESRESKEARGSGGTDLQTQVLLVGRSTPRAEDSEQTGAHRGVPDTLNSQAKLVGWGTPRETTNGGIPCPEHTGKGSRLEDQAAECRGMITPSPSDATPGGGSWPAGYRLNPYFSAWLMGFPIAWTQCGRRAASRYARRSRGG